jgi:arginine exporter protein ArgO
MLNIIGDIPGMMLIFGGPIYLIYLGIRNWKNMVEAEKQKRMANPVTIPENIDQKLTIIIVLLAIIAFTLSIRFL